MDSSTPDSTIYQEAAARIAHQLPALTWLQEIRERALQRFTEQGFPTIDHEDWRYTDLRETAELSARYLTHPSTSEGIKSAGAMPGGAGEAAVLLANGVPNAGTTSIPGVTIHALSESDPAAQSQLAARIDAGIDSGWDALAALNAALLGDGLVIDVADGAIIDSPIYLVCTNHSNQLTQNRILLRLGTGSRATFIEHHTSAGEGISNTVTDIVCEPESALRYVKIQEEAPAATHLAIQRVTLDDRSRADLLHLDFGAHLARNDLHAELCGSGAEVSAHGLFHADGERHLDNHTRIDHRAPHTVSRELYRGVVDGTAHGIFNGKIIVHPGAVGTDARLRNQNLLLSPSAEINTKPELEIYTDDVRCSHGATTGQLDAAAIFYLRSRGISAEQARRMLIASFVGEILKMAPPGAAAAHLTRLLGERLPEIREVAGLP